MTNKMGAVAKAHPPRNVRDALLRVLQQPAGIAQSGAADKFTCRFTKLGVKQAIKLTLAQLDVLASPAALSGRVRYCSMIMTALRRRESGISAILARGVVTACGESDKRRDVVAAISSPAWARISAVVSVSVEIPPGQVSTSPSSIKSSPCSA